MTELILPMWGLVLIFLFIAFAYSSVGLGGGSSYTAVMLLLGFSSIAIPFLSLSFNLLVTSLGSYQFIRQDHLRLKLILPFLLSSMPMAWVGGTLQITTPVFQWLLFLSLIAVVVRIYIWKNTVIQLSFNSLQQLLLSLVAGAILGLLSGIVGIGGGIFLVPIILILGLGSIREAAACGAVFIWLNSLSGIASRLHYNLVDLDSYLPLFVAVVLGGLVGSRLGAVKLSPQKMEKTLGGIIIVALVFLGNKLILH